MNMRYFSSEVIFHLKCLHNFHKYWGMYVCNMAGQFERSISSDLSHSCLKRHLFRPGVFTKEWALIDLCHAGPC